MLIGNQSAYDVLGKYMWSVEEKADLASIFLIGIGAKSVGKTTMILDIVKKMVGDYMKTDFLYVRDCSEFIGKKHTLKIALSGDNKKQFIEVEDGNLYKDIGVREINEWLQKSAIGKVKILYIENMERMNNSSANAFLKVSEEPLKNRIIVGTTSNSSMLLDTLLSRAVQIKFQLVAYDDLIKYCDVENLFAENIKLREFICRMVMWKPGLLHRYQTLFVENSDLEKIFLEAIQKLEIGNSIFTSHQLLLTIKTAGILPSFLDGWIAYSQEKWNFSDAEKWLRIRKMMDSNVSLDNLLLLGLI